MTDQITAVKNAILKELERENILRENGHAREELAYACADSAIAAYEATKKQTYEDIDLAIRIIDGSI